jgi:hypothetical protein
MQTWSDVGVLADKDFGEFTPDEITRARIALERLEWSRANGERAAGSQAVEPESIYAVRSLAACGPAATSSSCRAAHDESGPATGPAVRREWVDGTYSRMLLHFAHALTRRQRRVEAFCSRPN